MASCLRCLIASPTGTRPQKTVNPADVLGVDEHFRQRFQRTTHPLKGDVQWNCFWELLCLQRPDMPATKRACRIHRIREAMITFPDDGVAVADRSSLLLWVLRSPGPVWPGGGGFSLSFRKWIRVRHPLSGRYKVKLVEFCVPGVGKYTTSLTRNLLSST